MGCTGSREARRDARYARKNGDSDSRSVAHNYPTLGSFLLKSDDYSTSDDELMMKATDDCKISEVSFDKTTSTPETPARTLADEPETINIWELMEGLEDSLMSNSDPESLKYGGVVKSRITAFQQKINEKRLKKRPPHGEKKVVLYFTSLRGIRKTYEDCCAVKEILQGYNVRIDERDVSMHSGFKEELTQILGVGFGGSRLPRIFANGKYLGGVNEVRQMNEDGELAKVLEECEAMEIGSGGRGVCEGCGDLRFVPCETCYGSCKVFVEEEEEIDGGFRRCRDCNENGLVQCQICL